MDVGQVSNHNYYNSWVLMSPVYLFVNPSVNCGSNQTCKNYCHDDESFSESKCSDWICS